MELFTEDGGISHINGKSYPIRKGSILIAQPGDKRQSTLHFSALFIHVGTNDKAIQQLIGSISGFHPEMDFHKWEPVFIDIYETALKFEPNSDILASAKLITFLCSLQKDCCMDSITASVTGRRSAVSDAIEFMKQHYAEPLTVDKISAHCCLSSSHFYKLFLQTVHTTPNNYLLTLRVSSAKTLLVTTTMPISEIASRCGFNSQAYFSDCFKRQTGMNPRQFRSMFIHPDEN